MILSTLLAYLEDPAFLNATEGKHLDYASRDEIQKKATELLVRLFQDSPPPMEDNQDNDDDPDEPELIDDIPEPVQDTTESVDDPSPPKRSDSDDFKDCLNPTPEPKPTKAASPLEIIQEDMSSYERDGERPKSLQKVITFEARCD